MKRLTTIFLILAAVLLWACEFRPLLEQSNTHYVRVYIDEEIKNVTTGFYNEDNVRPVYKSPGILRITLADQVTGRVVSERFLRNIGHDENGKYYDGYIAAEPGYYSLMVYNFDMETTRVLDINYHHKAKAYTNEIATHLKTRIPSRANASAATKTKGYDKVVYDPDHLFRVGTSDVYIPYTDYVDTLRSPDGTYFRAESMIKSYFLQVRVVGMEYASSSVGLVTGVAGSGWLHSGEMDVEDPVTVYFDMLPGHDSAAGVVKGDEDGVVTVYTTFNTFGKIAEMESELEITFDFLTIYGEPYSETIDITDLFSTRDAIENHWLLIDHTIEIPEPPDVPGGNGGGGFSPSVGDWNDINTEIQI